MSKRSGGSEWALVVAPEPPYPVAGGGAIRTASLCHFLASRYRLHLITFGPPRFVPPDFAEQVDWVTLPQHSKTFPARVARNAGRLWRGVLPLTDRFSESVCRKQVARAIGRRRYRLAVLEHFWCAGYRGLAAEHSEEVVLDLHNIESELHERSAATDGHPARWVHQRFRDLARRAELDLLPQFDRILTTSASDAAKIRALAPSAQVVVYPNAIPFRFPAAVPEDHCIGFSGNLEYHPNVAAVRFFAAQVWPALRARDPQLRWRLIGKNEQAVARWVAGDPRIELTGPVEDALAELARVRVVVVPLLAGSGTRIKILEAWAASRAVVSTRIGAEGLPAVHRENLLLADSPSEILEASLVLLQEEALRRRLGEAGRRLVEEQFCWPAAWQSLEQWLGVELGKPTSCDSQ
jgi:glycosyltransferase involved in cell wall biosynthesis